MSYEYHNLNREPDSKVDLDLDYVVDPNLDSNSNPELVHNLNSKLNRMLCIP